MRSASSTSMTKILPSPIRPVRAALAIASTTRSARPSSTTTSNFTLGRKSTTYSAPRYSSVRSEEHTSELQSQSNLVCRLLLEKKKKKKTIKSTKIKDNTININNLLP